tara:strand:- start:5216 stop:5440 length:225 start_codon:yes stop_codon:yes gene_type:complete
MYRPLREWAWNEKAEQEYKLKRKAMAGKGYVTDEEVCGFFAENGIENVRPEDVRPMMLDAITTSPFESLMRSLS